MTHRLNFWLLMLTAIFGLPFYWLLIENPGRAAAPYHVSITQLRALAASIPGQRPQSVQMIPIGTRHIIGNYFAAGSGLKRRTFAALCFRLPVAGQGPVIIDPGTSPQIAKALEFDTFYPRHQAAVQQAMLGANLILATNELPLHLGGLAAFSAQSDAAQALTRAKLNAAQVPNPVLDKAVGWPQTLLLRASITTMAPAAVAPGVVVIPTGAPNAGSQIIYVRLATGREYIFAGDLAPFAANALELRVRSNLLEWREPSAGRAAAMRWLVTLRALRRQAPGLIVLPGHDFEWIADPEQHTGVQIIKL